MKKAKNNKGFSLVELIVVVLILGILAVAISPQVMKWVGKSKVSADKDSGNALKSSISTALADWQYQGGIIPSTGDFKATVNGSLTIDSGSADWGTTPNLLSERIAEVTAGDYPTSQYDSNGFTITVSAGTGKVSVEYTAKSMTN